MFPTMPVANQPHADAPDPLEASGNLLKTQVLLPVESPDFQDFLFTDGSAEMSLPPGHVALCLYFTGPARREPGREVGVTTGHAVILPLPLPGVKLRSDRERPSPAALQQPTPVRSCPPQTTAPSSPARV